MLNEWSYESFAIYVSVMVLCAIISKLSCKNVRNETGVEERRVVSWRLFCAFIPMLIILSIRDISRGGDLQRYFYKFVYTPVESIKSILLLSSGGEPGFKLYEFFIGKISGAFNGNLKNVLILYCFSMAIAWIYFIYKAIKEESEHNGVAIAICAAFIQLFFASFSMLRQSIAIGIMAYAFTQLAKGKKKNYWLLLILAISFHYTAIIGVAAYFFTETSMHNPRKGIALKLFVFVLMALFFVFGSEILDSLFGDTEKYSTLGMRRRAFGLGQLAMHLPVVLILLYFKKDLIKHNPNNKLYVDLTIFDLFVSQLNYVNPSFNRLDNYFYILCIFWLPSLYVVLKEKIGKSITNLIVVIGLTIWLILKIRFYIYTTPYYIMPYFTNTN